MHGEIDAEALLGAIDEFLAERDTDVGEADALAVPHDRRHGEDAEVSRPISTPTIDLPVLIDSTTVTRRAEMSSPNNFGA